MSREFFHTYVALWAAGWVIAIVYVGLDTASRAIGRVVRWYQHLRSR